MKIRSPHFKRQYDLSKAELIGEGNFAQVYRIFDNELNDSLAIRKVKKSESDMEDIAKQKVINEELRKVENQNILKIYDIIDTEEAVWYITEYCSGGSLWDVLNLCKDNKMNEKQCLQCVLQISKGVQQLHNHRITHRDLKPENILLKTKYTTKKPLPLIKLADFGLSTQKIIMQTIAGTKQYIAPEQAKFHNYTNAVDVWSLGIICDQILHGTPFYSGQNNKQVFNKILKLPYKVRDQTIRTSIKNILTSLLKKKPYERPIIAVIRKTIQKILEQIEAQAPTKSQRLKKRESKDESFHSSNHSANLNKYTNLLGLDSRKVQAKRVVQGKQDKQVKQTSMQKKQTIPPNVTILAGLNNGTNTNSASKNRKQESKRQISGKKLENRGDKSKQSSVLKNQSKPVSPHHQRQLSQKSSRQTKAQNKVVEDQKLQYKTSDNEQKGESNLMTKNCQNVQIPIYRGEKRNIIPYQPVIKKIETRSEQMQVGTYIQKLLLSKKELQQVTIVMRMQKSPSFLPNTSFSSTQFRLSATKTGQSLTQFKKQYQILNYVQYSEEYEMSIYRKQIQVQKNKRKCLDSFRSISEQLKQQFLQQVNKYVQNYVDKNLK